MAKSRSEALKTTMSRRKDERVIILAVFVLVQTESVFVI